MIKEIIISNAPTINNAEKTYNNTLVTVEHFFLIPIHKLPNAI